MAQNQKNLMTQEGYNKLVEELEYTRNVVQKKNREDLQAARSQGDLSENADYDAARDDQAKIAAKIKELEAQIKNAEIIKDQKHFTIKFLGNVEDGEEEIEEFDIVGSHEADPLQGTLSIDSPLGRAIIDAKVGDKVCVTPETNVPFFVEIIAIR